MLKPIPEELKKQGVRWVKAVSWGNEKERNALMIVDLSKRRTIVDCICVQEGFEEKYLKGQKVGLTEYLCFSEIPQPQEPKKIPYTAETFPDNAIRIKNIETGFIGEMVYKSISGVYIINECVINSEKCNFKGVCCSFDDIEKYEIGCQAIKDGEIKIEWQPFYEIKEEI